MNSADFWEIFGIISIGSFSGLMFFVFGMKLILAIVIAVLFMTLGFSLINYLTGGHDKSSRKELELKRAEEAFKNHDFRTAYSSLAKLAGLSTGEIHRAFQVAAIVFGKSEFMLLREALDLEPRL